MITEAWLPEDLSDTLTAPALAGAPLFHLLHDAGSGWSSLDHELTAEIAGPRTAGLLGTPIGAPADPRQPRRVRRRTRRTTC